MIYVNGLEGRQGYQKLHSVLDIGKMEKVNKDGYEVLSKVVDENYQTFSSNMRKKQARQTFSSQKKDPYRPDKDKSSILNLNKILQNAPKIEPIFIEEKSNEDKFLKFFKNAINRNQDIIKNSNQCIQEIDSKFVKKKIIVKKMNRFMNIKNNFNNDNEMAKKENNLSYEGKSKNLEEDKNCEKSKRSKDNVSSSKEQREKDENGSSKKEKGEELNKMSMTKKDTSSRQKAIKKLEKCLVSSLTYLYNNDVSLKDFFEKNPFPSKPYNIPFCHEFFDAVKFDNHQKVQNFVMRDKRYLFSLDYFYQTAFHWAAKRGYSEMMTILVNNGNSFNQTDYNHRTPLWHAAKNNHYQVCEILLHKIANPFIESKCGKKPLDITTDANIRKLLNEHMEKFSYMNNKNFFLTKVIKTSRDIMINSIEYSLTRKKPLLPDSSN